MNLQEIQNMLFESNPTSSLYVRRYTKFIESMKSKGRESGHLHHILPKSMWFEYSNLTRHRWNGVLLSEREHFIAHWMLYRAFNNKETQRAVWLMSHVNGVKVTSKQHEKLRESLRAESSNLMSKTMKGKSTFKDSEGNHYHTSTSDPIINERGLVHISSGMSNFKDSDNNIYHLRTDDPLISELGLVHSNVGVRTPEHVRLEKKEKVTVKDKNGSVFLVPKTDPRYLSGELVHMNVGTVNVISEGKKTKVTLSEFEKGNYQHINKGRVDVIDTHGCVSKVDRNDPRLTSGELKLYTSNKTRETARSTMIKYNKSMIGSKWMVSPNGKVKQVKPELFEEFLNSGWKFGRKLKYEYE